MDQTTMKRSAALVGAGVLAAAVGVGVSPAPAGAVANESISQGMSCVARKFITYNGYPGALEVDFNATLRGTVNSANTAVTITSIDYSFTNAKFIPTTGIPSSIGLSVGSSSNLNVKSPVTRNSADSMGGSGNWNVANFTVSKGGQVALEGIPDISGAPDPACTAYANLNWK